MPDLARNQRRSVKFKTVNAEFLPTAELRPRPSSSTTPRNQKGNPRPTKRLSKKDIFPRTHLTLWTLSELDIEIEKCRLYEGQERERPDDAYRVICVPPLCKTVLVCDLAFNSTYVIHTAKWATDYAQLTKGQLLALARRGDLTVIAWTNQASWCERLQTALLSPVRVSEWVDVQLEELPPNWLTAGELRDRLAQQNDLNVTQSWLETRIEDIRHKHPNDFQVGFRSGQGVYEGFSPKVQRHLQNEAQHHDSISFAPDGWHTAGAIAKQRAEEGKGGASGVRNTIERLKVQNHFRPEWEQSFRDQAGKVATHYAPAFCQPLHRFLDTEDELAAGRSTPSGLAKRLERSGDFVQSILERLKQNDPTTYKQWVHTSRNTGYQYLDPKLEALIEQEVRSIKSTPNGWVTAKALQRSFAEEHQLYVTQSVVQRLIDEVRDGMPEDFGEYWHTSGTVREHLSPQAQRRVKWKLKSFHETPYAPHGWKTIARIQREHLSHIDYSTVDRAIKLLRSEASWREAWAGEFRNETGPRTQYFSPVVIRKLIRFFEDENSLQMAWSTRQVAEEFERSIGWVQNKLRQLKEENPKRYNQMVRTSRLSGYQYMSNDFVEFLKQETPDIPIAPKDWWTAKKLQRSQREKGNKVNQTTVQRLLDQQRSVFPGDFKMLRMPKGQVREHFSPRVRKKAEREVQKIFDTPSAPEGWLTKNGIRQAYELNVDARTIVKAVELIQKTNRWKDDWRQTLRDRSGTLSTFYSPTLIRHVLSLLSREAEIQKGFTPVALSKHLGQSVDWIRERLKKLRQQHSAVYRKLVQISQLTGRQYVPAPGVKELENRLRSFDQS